MPLRRPAGPPAVFTALVVADRVDEPLTDTLDALLGQSVRPDHVVVVDTSEEGSVGAFVRDDPSTGPDGAAVEVVADPGAEPRRAVTSAVLDDRSRPDTTHVWLLTADSAPAPDALRALASAVRSSPSVGVAGPKLVSWEDPSRLQAFGIQATRLGRLVPAPRSGVPDQGQYNHRTDTLAVPFEGLFVERDVFAALHGFEPIHGDVGGDLDLCWRAQQSGHRAVLVPAALVRVVAAGHGAPTPAQRREARRVALTPVRAWSAPLLALWLVLTGVLAALGLLLLKRPRAAWQELSDVGGALTPWQAVSARWRSRGMRIVARRDLTGLYVTSGQVARAALDSLQDAVAPDADVDERVTSADDDEERAGPSPGPASVLRHPGVLALLTTVVMTVVAARSIPGSMLERAESASSGVSSSVDGPTRRPCGTPGGTAGTGAAWARTRRRRPRSGSSRSRPGSSSRSPVPTRSPHPREPRWPGCCWRRSPWRASRHNLGARRHAEPMGPRARRPGLGEHRRRIDVGRRGSRRCPRRARPAPARGRGARPPVPRRGDVHDGLRDGPGRRRARCVRPRPARPRHARRPRRSPPRARRRPAAGARRPRRPAPPPRTVGRRRSRPTRRSLLAGAGVAAWGPQTASPWELALAHPGRPGLVCRARVRAARRAGRARSRP